MAETPGQGVPAPETAVPVQANEESALARLGAFTGVEDEQAPVEETEDQGASTDEQASADEAEQTEEPTEAASEQEVEIDPDAPLLDVTVKVEGGGEETRKISLNEAKLGYMRREDYQRKTAEVAREREKVVETVTQQVQTAAAEYAQNLDVIQRALLKFTQAELGNIDIARLAEEDPAEAVRVQTRAQQANLILQAAAEEAQRMKTQAQAQAHKAFADATRKCVETLQAEVPGWGAEMARTVSQTGINEYGFTQEELNTLSDARMVRVLIDAHKFRQLQASKPAIKNKVAAVPKIIKPGTKNEGKPDTDLQKLRTTFKKSGNIRDAAKYLEKFL